MKWMTRQRSEETSGGGLRKPEVTIATKGESKSEDTTQNHFGVLAGRRSIAGDRRSTAKNEGRKQRLKDEKNEIDNQGRSLNELQQNNWV